MSVFLKGEEGNIFACGVWEPFMRGGCGRGEGFHMRGIWRGVFSCHVDLAVRISYQLMLGRVLGGDLLRC